MAGPSESLSGALEHLDTSCPSWESQWLELLGFVAGLPRLVIKAVLKLPWHCAWWRMGAAQVAGELRFTDLAHRQWMEVRREKAILNESQGITYSWPFCLDLPPTPSFFGICGRALGRRHTRTVSSFSQQCKRAAQLESRVGRIRCMMLIKVVCVPVSLIPYTSTLQSLKKFLESVLFLRVTR